LFDNQVTLGQRNGLSPIDAQQMNLLYKGECSGGGGGGGGCKYKIEKRKSIVSFNENNECVLIVTEIMKILITVNHNVNTINVN